MGVHTVQQLLAVDRIRFRYLRSVSDKVRREIRERAKRLAEIRPELLPGGGSDDAQAWASVDRLFDPTSTLWTSLSRETRGRPRVLRVSIELWC
jgi:hypothetical protein